MNLKYPLYKKDSSLKLVTVTTIDGNTEYKANCLKFPEGYYVKNVHTFYTNGRWYRKDDCVYDHQLQTYVKDNRNLLQGVVAIDAFGKVDKGYFSPNPYTNCIVIVGVERLHCIDYKLLKQDLFIESLSEGVYYRRSDCSAGKILRCNTKFVAINNNNNVYNIVDDGNGLLKMIKLHKESPIQISKEAKYISNYIKGLTFGAEIETVNGTLPTHIRNQYGVIICKDGSLRDEDGSYPPEYVTIPLSGAKGIQTLRDVAKEITLRSNINNRCSLHLHLGGFEIDRLFIISLYKLCVKIQNDIFRMFPYYKRNEVKYVGKEKNYCKFLPDVLQNYKSGDFNNYVNSAYNDVYGFLTGGGILNRHNNFNNKRNPWGGNKWEIKSRYYWVNFTNFAFGKQNTIEFRVHTPTTNPDKITNWLLMCNAIIQYAKNNTKKCISDESVSFKDDVLSYYAKAGGNTSSGYGSRVTKRLKEYYTNRVDYFKNDFENADYVSDGELLSDATFNFNTITL